MKWLREKQLKDDKSKAPSEIEGIKRRVLFGVSGNVVTQAVNIFIQLAGVPILLKYWGINYYGEWLVLYTIPGYIEISDFGLGTAATAEMSMLNEAKEYEKVRITLRNTFWFILIAGGIPFVLLYLSQWLVPWHELLNFRSLEGGEFRMAFSFLILYMYLSLFLTLPLGYYRVEKKYHRERYISVAFRVLEFGALVSVVMTGHGVAFAALALVMVKLVYFATILFDLHKKYEGFRLGPIGFNFSQIRHLIKPSLSQMIIYLGQNILNQGLTTLIGVKLGSVQVVIFSTSRTLINFSRQLVGIINLSFVSEFSYAYGVKNMKLLVTLFRRALQLNITSALLILLAIVLTADIVLRIWTDGNVHVVQPFFLLMAIAALVNSAWNGALVLLMATNKQYKSGVYYLITAVSIILLSFVGMNRYGLTWVGVSLICFELCMSQIIYRNIKGVVNIPVNGLFSKG